MAILWKKKVDGKTYEIRASGKRRRLFTNGVCHTEYNPTKVSTGSIWDLLVIPAFFNLKHDLKRVLVLGVGGGAAIRQLLALFDIDLVIGIELDRTHLYIAKQFFGLDSPKVQLIEANAEEWLYGYQGQRFDMIIEDLFIEERNEPIRAVKANAVWMKALTTKLTKEGVLVMNFVSSDEIKSTAYHTNKKIAQRFKSAFQLTTPDLDNYVAAYLKEEGDGKILRKNLHDNHIFSTALANKSLRYRLRRLTCSN